MEELLTHSVFYQLVAVMAVAAILGVGALLLRQPLIVAFILTGILAGPDVLNITGHGQFETIETLSHFGIAVLLFMVGLKLDLRILKQTGVVALIVGLLQVFLTTLAGAAICFALGFSLHSSMLMGVALAFSSTIIAVKLLSDKRSIDSLYGQIALGILIVQDLLVIAATIVIAGVAGSSEEDAFKLIDFFLIIGKGTILVVLTALFIRFVADPFTQFVARSTELMGLFSISFAVLMASICEFLGFSKELGGLVAGIALASTPYNNIMSARLSTLRDFLLLFFFVNLGSHMSLGGIEKQIAPAIAISIFVLIGKPIIIMAVMKVMQFRKRTGALTGLSLGQISEFSLILMAMGYEANMVDQEVLNLITLVGLITMGLSTYGIIYSDSFYSYLEQKFAYFRRDETSYREDKDGHKYDKDYDVIIFGLGRYGLAMAEMMIEKGYSVLGVDFNPEAVSKANDKGVCAVYGDASDPEYLSHLPLEKSKAVIFAFHHYITGPLIADLRRTLAKALKEQKYKGLIAATSHDPEYDKDLKDHGIDIVFQPFQDAALQGVEKVTSCL